MEWGCSRLIVAPLKVASCPAWFIAVAGRGGGRSEDRDRELASGNARHDCVGLAVAG